jgi:hypothetical protein
MEATELIAKLLEINGGVVEMALDGLPDEKFDEGPTDDTNPVGWLLWHKTRVEDAVIAHVTDDTQVWPGGWAEKFGADPSPQNIGMGHKPETVHSLKFTKAELKTYADAVREKTNAALKSLSPEDLEKEIPDFFPGQTIRVGEMLGRGLIADNIQHSGQVCYLRGYHTGFGWMPF